MIELELLPKSPEVVTTSWFRRSPMALLVTVWACAGAIAVGLLFMGRAESPASQNELPAEPPSAQLIHD